MKLTGFVYIVLVLGLFTKGCSATLGVQRSPSPLSNCGKIGGPCCQGTSCLSRSMCTTEGDKKICRACGKNGQKCCDGQCFRGLCKKEGAEKRCRPVTNPGGVPLGVSDDDAGGGVLSRAPPNQSSCGKHLQQCCPGKQCNVGKCDNKGMCDNWQVTTFTRLSTLQPVPQPPRQDNRFG